MHHEMPIGVKYSIISRAFKTGVDEQTRKMGLTAVQSGALRAIRRLSRGGTSEVNQRDVEEALGLTHQTVTEIVKKLESKGFIECRKSELDKRSKAISLTDKSEELFESFGVVDSGVIGNLCAGIEEDKINTMIEVIDRMVANILENRNCKNN